MRIDGESEAQAEKSGSGTGKQLAMYVVVSILHYACVHNRK